MEESEMSGYFPLFVNLRDCPVIVVGAGTVASRRIRILASFGCRIRVVAPEGAPEMEELSRNEKVEWIRREFADRDLDWVLQEQDRGTLFLGGLAVAASGDRAVNDRAARLCREKRVPVNHAGDQTQCDFFFPGIIRDGELVVGVTASGKNHRLAKLAVEEIRKWLSGRNSGRMEK